MQEARVTSVYLMRTGPEAEPEADREAGYSTASRRGSVARTRNAMLLFRQRNKRLAGDPGDIKKPVSRDAY